MTIVVGVDGSTGSLRALEWAATEAALRGSTLLAVRAYTVPVLVLGPDALTTPPVTDADVKASSAKVLATQVGCVREAWPELQIVERCVRGPAAAVLRDQADDASALLLVVGSRGLGGFKGLLLGSVSSQCLHHPPRCPVVMVPDTTTQL